MLPLSRRRVGRKKLKITALGFIFLSMFLPFFMGSDIRGFQALCFGWLPFLTNEYFAGFTWLSGPIVFITLWLSPGRRKLRRDLSGAAVILGLFGLFITRLPMDDTSKYLNVMPGFGYVFYMLGIIGIFIYHLERWKARKR